ncbi:hypothetical protein ACTTZI_004166 [Vibrio vulnificus]
MKQKSRTISRCPSFSPTQPFRNELATHREGITSRMNTLYERYSHLRLTYAIRLEQREIDALQSVLDGIYIKNGVVSISDIENLTYHVKNVNESLFLKLKHASFPELLATVDILGF